MTKVDRQEADTIINVANNLNNTGELNVDKLYLNGSQAEHLFKPDQETLQAQFSIDYLSLLNEHLKSKKLIRRSAVEDILGQTNGKSELAICGNPGVGKTCVLYAISQKRSSAVYINLKSKSLKTVVSHLINKINIVNGQQLISISDIDAGLEILQGQLMSSEMTFLLDECEMSSDVLEKILPLGKGKNTFIYASQSDYEFTKECVPVYNLGTFNISEAQLFLAEYQITLEVMAFNELFAASEGNALFLFYFSQFSIYPIPQGIDNYQQAIWRNLGEKEKDSLIFIAVAYLPISIKELHDLLKFDSLQLSSQLVSESRLINMAEEGLLTVFHPAFKEFIIKELTKFGIISHYKDKLGEYFENKNKYMQATYLLLDESNPQRVEKFGLAVLPYIIERGDLELATRLIRVLLQSKRSKLTEGYLKLHLYQNLRSLRQEGADLMLEESLNLLKKSKNKKIYTVALMNKAIDLIEHGDVEGGLKISDSIMEQDDGSDRLFSGQLLVSLSKIFVDLHQFEKAADAAKKAYEYCTAEDDDYGAIASLSNLSSALGQMTEHIELAEKYARVLLEVQQGKKYYNTQLIVLNVLTSLSRQKKNYSEARKFGAMAVSLCQQYKLEHKATLNLINYGNVVRDEGDIPSAMAIYNESLSHAVKLNLKKEQARIYWILSGINAEQGERVKALDLINQSIQISKEVNYDYGLAHGYEDRAKIYENDKASTLAGESYEKAFYVFKRMGNMLKHTNYTLTKAILGYTSGGNSDKVDAFLKLSIESLGSKNFIDLSRIYEYEEATLDIHKYIYELTERYISIPDAENIVVVYINYVKYCKQHLNTSKNKFRELILLLGANTRANKFIRSVLAILIEQSWGLLDYNDIKVLIESIEDNEDTLYTRETLYEFVFLFSLSDDCSIEMICFKDQLTCIKLALNFILFSLVLPDYLELNMPLTTSFVKIMMIDLASFKDVSKAEINISFDDDYQVATYEAVDKNIIPLIVNDEYETAADLLQNEDNMCNFLFIRTLQEELARHFFIVTDPKVTVTSFMVGKVASLYDMKDSREMENPSKNYEVDLTLLKNSAL